MSLNLLSSAESPLPGHLRIIPIIVNMARTATGKNSAKAGAGLTKGNGIDILDKDERLDELYDDPESDVALVSKDGVVFKYYSGMLKKKR